MATSDVLSLLREKGRIEALDFHLARTLTALAGETSPLVQAAVALCSQRVSRGDVCLPLADLAADATLAALCPALAAPEVQWRQALSASRLSSGEAGPAPIVLDPQGRLYLQRYHERERRLAQAITERVGRPALPVDEPVLCEGLARLFGGAEGAVDPQRDAAEMVVRRAFAVISGGPGTGKTSTVVKLLALLLEQAFARGQRAPRVALLAPTGKAAARLSSSIEAARPSLRCAPAVREAIAAQASTVHRALAAARPRLAADVVVVDEASMVDLELMSRLVLALPEGAQLVLLGDMHQLASVEAGAVLADLCGVGDGGAVSETGARLRGSIALLSRSYRYPESSGIGALARAVNDGDVARALEVLCGGRYEDATLAPELPDDALGPALAQQVLARFGPMVSQPRAEPALREQARFRLLCAHRRGPRGADRLNELVAHALAARGHIERASGHFAGRPVLVTENDPGAELWNGDLGVVLRGDDGALAAYFPGRAGAPRRVSLARLPAHESAFAMSVHKSQGSEADEIAVVLPAQASPVLCRELLYTAVTRARRRVVLYARPELVELCITRVTRRSSGLRDALYGPRSS